MTHMNHLDVSDRPSIEITGAWYLTKKELKEEIKRLKKSNYPSDKKKLSFYEKKLNPHK